jgi:glucose dehydrogenase
VWDSFIYDPVTDLVYIGVGNGSPWNARDRSPDGGDNLYLSSIVAVKADTGEYVWHYQTTPWETWDYTATQHIMTADIELKKAPPPGPPGGPPPPRTEQPHQ